MFVGFICGAISAIARSSCGDTCAHSTDSRLRHPPLSLIWQRPIESPWPLPVLVQASKAVMGAIDFDPFTTPDLNRLVCAAKIYDRNEGDLETAIAMDWDIPGEKRVFAGCAHGAEWTHES